MLLGNAVAVYGSLSEDHGNYTVSLDGGDARTFNAYAMYNYSQVLLMRIYLLGSLFVGLSVLTLRCSSMLMVSPLKITHFKSPTFPTAQTQTLILTLQSSRCGRPAQMFQRQRNQLFPNLISTSMRCIYLGFVCSRLFHKRRGLSTGAVAGIVASAVLALLSIAFAALWIMCRRRSRIRQDMDLTKEFFPTRPTKAYANGSWSSDAPLTRSADPGVIILGQNSETFSQQAQRGQSEGHLTENPVPGSPV